MSEAGMQQMGLLAAELIDQAAQHLPAGAELAETMIVCAFTWPVDVTEETGAMGQTVLWRCSSAFGWVQHGLLREAGRAVDYSTRDLGGE